MPERLTTLERRLLRGVKKKKVQLSFKQKRRKNKQIEKGVARAERL